MKNNLFLLFCFTFFVFNSQLSYAKQAKMLLMPTRVVMESNSKSATVELRNSGDASGQYSISLIDMKMEETGSIVEYPEGQKDEFSVVPFVHISPKSVTIGPGESQTIRIMQKRNMNPEAGEYRSHLRVKLENDNVEGDVSQNPPQKTSILVKAKLAMVIPVIFRVGETDYKVTLDGPKLAYDEQGKPKLEMYLNREGNRSAMGDFSISYKSPSGSERLITFYPGIAVYRAAARRLVSIPLDVPSGVNLKEGSLEITYSAQEQDGGGPLAKTTLNLQ